MGITGRSVLLPQCLSELVSALEENLAQGGGCHGAHDSCHGEGPQLLSVDAELAHMPSLWSFGLSQTPHGVVVQTTPHPHILLFVL